ncbi:MAG TPA: GNAT family N-acetyltransferase [Rubrivivax sp.]|nr:GNAT family N-acetyltransferase [Rubrivivax sp.]
MSSAAPDRKTTAHLHRLARSALGHLPKEARFALLRRMVDCDPAPDPRLQLGIASTEAELEACFGLLHDAYVGSGFMTPDPSGLRVTPYHALPTTTTLCARFDGEVVGTLSIIREGVLGFPMQSVFDLSEVRTLPGRIAEISALAVRPDFRSTGGKILFPLMKFMYEYCTRYFDTRHLVIAVNPKHIEMYEALLLFRRLAVHEIDRYDFVNGAPAIGATLDLQAAPAAFEASYGPRPPRKNLHHYFTQVSMPNIRFPARRYHTTNDPVMSPQLLQHFFSHRTRVFDRLDDRQRALLRAVYPHEAYRSVLPVPRQAALRHKMRSFRRYSVKCPAQFQTEAAPAIAIDILDGSRHGFLARTDRELTPLGAGAARIQLGADVVTTERVRVVRRVANASGHYYGFEIASPSADWTRFVQSLESGDESSLPGAAQLPADRLLEPVMA